MTDVVTDVVDADACRRPLMGPGLGLLSFSAVNIRQGPSAEPVTVPTAGARNTRPVRVEHGTFPRKPLPVLTRLFISKRG